MSKGNLLRFVLVLFGLVPTTALASDSCVENGLKVFREQGPAAALPVFEKKLSLESCRNDSILQLNYARTLKTIADKDGDGLGTCRAAEVFILVQSGRGVGASIRSLAADGATEVLERCRTVTSQMKAESYRAQSERATAYVRRGELWVAVIEWRVALRLNDQRLEAHRALCKLLPAMGMKAEAERRCESWKALVAEQPAISEDSDDERVMEWAVTVFAGGLLVAGGISFALASEAHSDLLVAHRRTLEARDAGDESGFYVALEERSVFESKMNDLQTASWALLAAGGITGAVATYLWLQNDDTSVVFTGRDIGLMVRW